MRQKGDDFMKSRAFVCGLVAVAAALVVAGPASANRPVLSGGEGSVWAVNDGFLTDNGQPQGGVCNFFGAAGSGAATEDAGLIGEASDAFDGATMVWVDGVQVGGHAAAFTPDEATFTPVTIAGLEVQLNYRALSTQSTLRVLVRLTNPTGAQITVPVEYVNNFGNGGGFPISVAATSSGDTSYGIEDRWIVTDDGVDPGGALTNTSVFYGPDSPPEMPQSTSATVFDCVDTEGSLDSFQLEIAPGETETLMFFQQLNPSAFEGQTDAGQFDTTPGFGHPLTAGMTPQEHHTLVNWTPAPLPGCSDQLDNDLDGWTDYPDDPECDSEFDDEANSRCSDGLDNDGDFATDYPNDIGCESVSDDDERNRCDDGLDNDGDLLTDYPDDPGCTSESDNDETNAACSDGIDNDGDGLTDIPFDPGCDSQFDDDESNGRCSDGLDNDGDGATDYPADPGCSSTADNNETNARCNDGLDNDGDGDTDYPDDPGCSSLADNNETNTRCNDGLDNDGDGLTDFPADPGCKTPSDNNETNAACNDNRDNDGDGEIDFPDDPGCTSATDNSETNAACNDGVDNDGDGLTDHSADPGCSSPTDNNETNPQCNDGRDNDGDGLTDHPADPGCSSLTDNREDR